MDEKNKSLSKPEEKTNQTNQESRNPDTGLSFSSTPAQTQEKQKTLQKASRDPQSQNEVLRASFDEFMEANEEYCEARDNVNAEDDPAKIEELRDVRAQKFFALSAARNTLLQYIDQEMKK